MTKRTTALVLTGPISVGAFNDDLWRVGATAQLIEGGNSGPVWLTAPAGHHEDGSGLDHLAIDSDDPAVVARSLVVLLVATVGDDALLALLGTSVPITVEEGRRVIGQPWAISDKTVLDLSQVLAKSLRLGIVLLSDQSVLDDAAVSYLRTSGFRVDVFAPPRNP